MMGPSTSWNPQDLPRPVMGLLYLPFCIGIRNKRIFIPTPPPCRQTLTHRTSVGRRRTRDERADVPASCHSRNSIVAALVGRHELRMYKQHNIMLRKISLDVRVEGKNRTNIRIPTPRMLQVLIGSKVKVRVNRPQDRM